MFSWPQLAGTNGDLTTGVGCGVWSVDRQGVRGVADLTGGGGG